MVIFGVSGDLTRRKLVPALFDLYQAGFLPDRFTVLGYARRDWSAQDMVREVGGTLAERADIDQSKLKKFFAHFEYQRGNFDNPTDYDSLAAKLQELDDATSQCGRRLFYLATPAHSYESILAGINRAKLEVPCGEDESWTRIVIEKPFGHDLISSQTLDKQLTDIFTEDQIYRIDHYLAKETAQNIMTFRFANAIFEPIWNAEHIDRIEITVQEEIGIGTRGNFYDKTGALRDVVQNHLLQLLALVTMDQPTAPTGDSFRDARAKLLSSICCFDLNHVGRNLALGQYAGYRKEADVSPDSNTETFAAVRVDITTPRWQGVPVFLVTGKRMAKAMTRITIEFKSVDKGVYDLPVDHKRNVLTFDIQPQEGIGLQLLAKQPGYGHTIQPVSMHFNYAENFQNERIDAYTRLLLDAIDGDQTLFTRSDEVAAEWRFIDPIIERIQAIKLHPQIYPDGSDGPSGLSTIIKGH